jgi:hypothetical protein
MGTITTLGGKFKFSGMLHRVNWETVTDLSNFFAASILRLQQFKEMEAVRTSINLVIICHASSVVLAAA